jgi:hypothetical protein
MNTFDFVSLRDPLPASPKYDNLYFE